MKKRILFVFRTSRSQILADAQKGIAPDSMLFGLNHLRTLGYHVDFFDTSYTPFNVFHYLFTPLEKLIIKDTGMGFKLDQAVLLLPRARSYDVIVCTGDSAGLPFIFLKHLGLIHNRLILLSSGLAGGLRPKVKGWVMRFYRSFFQALDYQTVYSEVERKFFMHYLKMPASKIQITPYGTDWSFFSVPTKIPRTIIAAIGIDSGRDYQTFFQAVKDLPIQAIVACHPHNVQNLDIPKNVTCEFLADYNRIRTLFQMAKVVVVPCKERYRSAGQMVTLEAASARAPIIVSAISGMTGAFRFVHKKHVYYVKPEDPKSLRQSIQYMLKNSTSAKKMGEEASQFVRDHYTSGHLAKNLAKIIDIL